MDTEVIKKMNHNIIELINRTGYELTQVNGQRLYTAPNIRYPPGKGCEIFVGKIPSDMFEDELVPIFEKIGPIYQLRLMLKFSGYNRGYAFVTYFDKETANMAVSLLHGAKVRPNSTIGVYKSLDNCRLYVGGIPEHKTKEEVHSALSEFVEGITDVIMYPSYTNRFLNRGYAFLDFIDQRYAAIAKKKLAPGSLIIWGVPILVDWADPLPDVDPAVMASVKKLYLRKLNVSLSEEELIQTLISKLYPIKIQKLYKNLDYAFIHLETRNEAEDAFKKLSDLKINGEHVEVSWARPKIYSKRYMQESLPQHFCVNLPPKSRKQVQTLKTQHINRNQIWKQNEFVPKNGANDIFNRRDMYWNDHADVMDELPGLPGSSGLNQLSNFMSSLELN